MGLHRPAVSGDVLVGAAVRREAWRRDTGADVEPVEASCSDEPRPVAPTESPPMGADKAATAEAAVAEPQHRHKRQCRLQAAEQAIEAGSCRKLQATLSAASGSGASVSDTSSSSSSSSSTVSSLGEDQDQPLSLVSHGEAALSDEYEPKVPLELGARSADCDAAKEMQRLRDRGAAEAGHIRLLSAALWGLASRHAGEASSGPLAALFSGKESPVPQAMVTCKLPRSASELASFLGSVVRSVNRFDIEMSDSNPLRRSQSLGFRTLLCSFVLVDRLLSRTAPAFALTTRNVCRVTAICMMLVSKHSEDEPLNNKYWSQITAVPLAELNRCELALVQSLDYRLRVSEAEYGSLLERMGIAVAAC